MDPLDDDAEVALAAAPEAVEVAFEADDPAPPDVWLLLEDDPPADALVGAATEVVPFMTARSHKLVS